MASKHFRKLEEERMLAAAAAANEEAEAKADASASRAGFSFAGLAGSSSDDESSSDSEDERERRAAAAEARANGQNDSHQQTRQKKQQQQQQQQQKQKQKQQAKKSKQKEKQRKQQKEAAATDDDWLNDEELLASVAAAQVVSEAETDILYSDPKFLDPQSELKRIFGGNVVKAAMREEQLERRGASGRRGRGSAGRGGTATLARRAVLVQPRDHWPPYTPGGLEMQVVRATSEEILFRFGHGDNYRQAQHEYEVAASSHDPNAIVGVLQFYPYHIDSLMQLAEVHSIRGGELERAGDMYERALFAMERAFHPDFTPWSTGKAGAAARACRLPYEIEENRPMHVALFRYAGLLGRRGVHRTAAEVCRLLISLEPSADPMGALLCFDYYCMRSGGCKPVDLLLPFVARFSFRQTLLLPNFSYSAALARRLADGDSGAARPGESLTLLQLQRLVSVTDPTTLAAEQLAARALALYPSMLSPLLAKIGAASEPVTVDVLGHPFFTDSVGTSPYSKLLGRLVDIYVERSAALHKPQVGWLVGQAQRLISVMDAANPSERALFDDAAHAVRLRALTGDHVPDSWSSVLLADFSDNVQALPADEMLGGNAHAGDDGAQNDTPFHVDRQMHPVLAFFATMLPSSGAPPIHGD